MKYLRDLPTSLALLALASCATQPAPPTPTPAPPVAAPSLPPPAGSQRLPGSLTCESEVSCYGCADDHDRELVRLSFLVHAAEVRACQDRAAAAHSSTEGRVVVRLGIDPTGAIATSCIVRTTLSFTAFEQCLMDLALTWKITAPASGGWALVDHPAVFAKASPP